MLRRLRPPPPSATTSAMTDPALRAAHGAAGEARAEAYSWDAINGAVAQAYLRLLNR